MEAYPYTWLQLRLEEVIEKEKTLSIRPITSPRVYFSLAQSNTDFTGASDMNGIATLSVFSLDPHIVYSIQ